MESLNLKIQSSSLATVSKIQNVGVYGYDETNPAAPKFRRIQSDAIGSLFTKDVSTFEDKRGFAQAELGTTVSDDMLLDSTIVPTADTNARGGWLCKNTGAGTKLSINSFFGAQEYMNTADLTSVYSYLFIDSFTDVTTFPAFEVYTKPTGTGDADPTYHSKFTYSIGTENRGHIGIDEEVVFWAITSPVINVGQRLIELNSLVVDGDGATGEVLKILLVSDTLAPVNTISWCVNRVGWQQQLSLQNIERNYRLITPEPPSAGGAATALNQELQLAQETIIALNTTDITTATQDISSKITVGMESAITESQQVAIYGAYNDSDLRPLKVDFNGRLMTQVDGVRANGNNTFTIPAGTTAVSPEIQMGQHTYIAFYGDTDNTTDTTIRIEYSSNGLDWYRGNGDNAKIIVVGATGNFYDEEHVTPPRVRLSKNNTTASLETITYYHTRL